MSLIYARTYAPISREDHHARMQTFINSMQGLPAGKYSYRHIVSDGVYMRELRLRKGTMIAGVVHKKETAMLMVKGSMKIFSEEGLNIVKAYSVKISPPGTQRAGIALEDTILVTVHSVASPLLEDIIEELAEDSQYKVSGMDEGNYKLYIRGRKVIDEDIFSSSDRIAVKRSLQRLLPD